MKSILIIFLTIQAYSLNAGKAFSKHSKESGEIPKVIDSFKEMSISNSSQSMVTSDPTDEKLPIFPTEILDYIYRFLPGNHPLTMQLAYNKKNYNLSYSLAENIVKAFKKTCVKVLRNHAQVRPSCKGKAKMKYNCICQLEYFAARKRNFLTRLELFFKTCPIANKTLIDSILQKNVAKLLANTFSPDFDCSELLRFDHILSLPMNHYKMIHFKIEPQEIKNINEKAVLVAIAKSRDKESKTATIIYDLLHADDELILLHNLLPSVLKFINPDNCKTSKMPENSPYFQGITFHKAGN